MQTDTFRWEKGSICYNPVPALHPIGLFLEVSLTTCKIISWYFLRACFVQGSEGNCPVFELNGSFHISHLGNMTKYLSHVDCYKAKSHNVGPQNPPEEVGKLVGSWTLLQTF